MTDSIDNITMAQGGLYSLATRGAKDVIDIATPRVIDAISSLSLSDQEHFLMADMGCADGGTSLDLVRSVLNFVKEKNPAISSSVIYADQPGNDFNGLVSIVSGRTSFKSWLGEIDNTFALFSGASFYTQATANQTLDLAFSATAMHWLSKTPCNISNHVHMIGASGDEYDRYQTQAKQDWSTILMHRSRELKSGGKAVFANFCRDEDGHYLGNTGGVNMFDTFNDIWKEFLSAGKITEQEYQNMTLPQYYNTVEEFSAPLTDSDNPVYQAGMRLDSIETGIVKCPFASQFEKDGDVNAFADGLIPTVRSWNQSIFTAGLASERSDSEKKELIESYYGIYHQRVLNAPEGHGMDYVHAYMTLSKL